MAGFLLRRHRHDGAVGDHTGLARESESLSHLLVAKLNGVLHRRRWNVPPEHLHPAAPAPTPLAAGGRDVDAGRPRRIEQRSVGRYGGGATFAAGRGIDERHGEFLWHASLSRRSASVRVSESRPVGRDGMEGRDVSAFGAGFRTGGAAAVGAVPVCRIRIGCGRDSFPRPCHALGGAFHRETGARKRCGRTVGPERGEIRVRPGLRGSGRPGSARGLPVTRV